MKNKILNLFLIIFMISLSSCANILEDKRGDEEFTFGIGKETAENIESVLSGNRNINSNTELKVLCELSGLINKSQTEVVTLEKLKNLTLKFENLPFGNDYCFTLSISLDNIVLYKGTSEKFNLSESERDVKIKIQLNKIKSSIEYILYDGFFTPEQENIKLNEYFIDTDYVIPIPDKLKNRFDGWYLDPEFTGEPVTELGKNNFVGNVKLYAKWTEIYEISEVANLTSVTDNQKITLNWENPKEKGFDKVIIKCDDTSVAEQTVTNPNNSAVFTGLTNGKKYNFSVTAYDKNGKPSKTMTEETFPLDISASAMAPLTEAVKSLPVGTNGSAGTSGSYIEFGDYPQSVKAGDVLVSDNTVKVNGFDCHYGSDSCYYVKQNYISYDRDSNNNYICAEFNDGTTMIVGKEYYFKLEPLKWRVLDPDYLGKGGKLLLSEKAISSCAYFNYQTGVASTRRLDGKVLYNNNYEHSKVRAFLNGLSYLDKNNKISKEFEGKGFINNAFTSTSINEVKEVIVDNSKASASSTIGDFACRNTNDKSFLLSYADSVNPKYNFNTNDSQTDTLKGRDSTEYARAMGAAFQKDAGFRTWWSLRTPNSGDWGHYRISWTYRTHPDAKILYDSYGVVPAIVVGGKYETPPSEVSNLKFEAGNNKVKLTWTEPEEADFAKVEVTCTENSQTKSANKGTDFIEFTGLTNGKKYNFTVKTVDKSNYKSTGSTIEVPLYLRTESIVELPAGTAGSIGAADAAGVYVEFGDYPQTFVKNAPVTAESVAVGGLTYYYGSDGYYYVKAKANPSASSNSGKNFGDKDNTPIDNGGEYCFRVEPVKWRVIANTYGGAIGKVLLAENVLVNSKFKSTTGAGANVYGSSELKTFVTGNMFNQLFSSTAQGNILQVNDTGTGLSNEKIFILSKDDVLNPDYGFVTDEKSNTARSRLTTDYSRALGAYSDKSTKNGSWWLRTNAPADSSASPAKNDSDYVWIVGTVGGTGNSETVNNSSGGVVPAVVVK